MQGRRACLRASVGPRGATELRGRTRRYQLTGGDAELPEVPYLGAWSGPLLLAVGGSVTLLAAVGCCAAASHGAATWAYLLALQVSRRRGWEARGGVSGLDCWRCQGCRPR